MEKETDLRRGRYVVFNLHVHLVFVAKYRRKVCTTEIVADMRPIFESVCTDFEAQLVEFDGENDHVHLLIKISNQLLAPMQFLAQRSIILIRGRVQNTQIITIPMYHNFICIHNVYR